MALPGLVAAKNLADVTDRERAWDNLGLNISETFQSWSPAQITTALWLDAADSSTITGTTNVTSWLDKSGNNRNATATTGPSLISAGLNGKNFLRFDANTEQFSINYAWPATQTVFLVTASNALTLGSSISAIYGTTSPQSFPNNTSIQTHNQFVSTTQRRLFFEVQSGATIATTRCNGSISGSLNIDRFQFVIAGLSASGMTQAGRNIAIPSPYFTAYSSDLAEVIVTTSLESLTNMQKLEGYLAHKWALTANLPNDHPYRNIPPAP
jgi:hypothetical protein